VTDGAPEIDMKSPRVGAAIVGTLSTWWVGLIIGTILGVVGLIHINGVRMLNLTLKALVLTIAIALVTGVFGFAVGKALTVIGLSNWTFPENILEQDNFLVVGTIHNFSYVGGLIGLIFGIRFSYNRRAL
jgi:hypothetical protein